MYIIFLCVLFLRLICYDTRKNSNNFLNSNSETIPEGIKRNFAESVKLNFKFPIWRLVFRNILHFWLLFFTLFFLFKFTFVTKYFVYCCYELSELSSKYITNKQKFFDIAVIRCFCLIMTSGFLKQFSYGFWYVRLFQTNIPKYITFFCVFTYCVVQLAERSKSHAFKNKLYRF